MEPSRRSKEIFHTTVHDIGREYPTSGLADLCEFAMAYAVQMFADIGAHISKLTFIVEARGNHKKVVDVQLSRSEARRLGYKRICELWPAVAYDKMRKLFNEWAVTRYAEICRGEGGRFESDEVPVPLREGSNSKIDLVVVRGADGLGNKMAFAAEIIQADDRSEQLVDEWGAMEDQQSVSLLKPKILH